MIEIYKSYDTDQFPVKIEKFEKGCWVNIVSPTEQELNFVESSLNIHPNFLRDPLDEEEKPRIDVEDNQTLVIVDIPYVYEDKDQKDIKYETIPRNYNIGRLLYYHMQQGDFFDSILQGEESKRLFYF